MEMRHVNNVEKGVEGKRINVVPFDASLDASHLTPLS
jgi:hypothetical protein